MRIRGQDALGTVCNNLFTPGGPSVATTVARRHTVFFNRVSQSMFSIQFPFTQFSIKNVSRSVRDSELILTPRWDGKQSFGSGTGVRNMAEIAMATVKH